MKPKKNKAPASRKRPLSPAKALQHEIRTLDRAQDKVLSDAAIEERQSERAFERKWKAITRQEMDLAARNKRDVKASDAAVARALNQITSRRARLQARLAAL